MPYGRKAFNMKRILSIILVLITLLSVLAACSDGTKLPKAEDGRTVLTVGGEKLCYDYIRYVYLNTKADMVSYADSAFQAEKELKDAVLETVVHNRAIAMLASELGISLTKEEKKSVNESLDALKEDKKSWELAKKNGFMTDYSYAYVQRFMVLWGKVFDYVTDIESGVVKADDATVLADVPVNFSRIRYIYIEYGENEKQEKKALSETVLGKINDGEDFDALIKEYGDDSTMLGKLEEGYYYTAGSIQEEVEDAVNKLGSGEVSPIIETASGFYIIQKLNIDMEYVEKNLDEFVYLYMARRFNEMVADIEKDMKIEYSDIWNKGDIK